ncbi:type VI secretion system protein TssA [Aidingimonas halophila]|uniref:Type VI secretion system protein VasJ n=1 Tax=Aidingimonas halophila TaxID=574349 RepID=A0A1H2ZKE5_9GAMM|nr:type VI secretion system protein TssA [Aidingimonas halophila]GHC16231.1 type VI secretion-associated protein [Aidingimonas halophila]SDX17861.1 type VI secretion system protein VasJ [Aidingimonas halophila]
MRITTETQLSPILESLSFGSDGIGHALDDHEEYAWLDQEMLKVGSLQHGTIDWQGAENCAATLLAEQGKHLKVLGHLLHCLQREGDGMRFALSLRLLSGVLERWWHLAYPFAGPRGAKGRARLFQQLTQRASVLAQHIDFTAAGDEYKACCDAVDALVDQADGNGLPVSSLHELRRLLATAEPRDMEVTQDTSPSSPPRQGAASSTHTPAAAAADMSKLALESGNDRANRQTLLKLADHLNEQAQGEPLGYRLRRYAIWHGIHAPPPSRDGGATELMPPSADRVADYRDAVASGITPEGGGYQWWQRIEHSLAVSPYWLEGHRLSAEVAIMLGHERCAESIRDELHRFVRRLEGIDALMFNDGTPFMDEATRQWLASSPDERMQSVSHAGGDPWQEAFEEARRRMNNDGLAMGLAVLEEGLDGARSPRDDAYWRLASADLLHEAGLHALAKRHYQALYQTLSDIDLSRWEPGLLSRLEMSLKG